MNKLITVSYAATSGQQLPNSAHVKKRHHISVTSPPKVIWEEHVATLTAENAFVCYMC